MTYHPLPFDPEMRRKWLDVLDLRPRTIRKTMPQVCSYHFQKEDFDGDASFVENGVGRWTMRNLKMVRNLRPDAVPSIAIHREENRLQKKADTKAHPDVHASTSTEESLDSMLRRRDFEGAVEGIQDLVFELQDGLRQDDAIHCGQRRWDPPQPPPDVDSRARLRWQAQRIKNLEGRLKELSDICTEQDHSLSKVQAFVGRIT